MTQLRALWRQLTSMRTALILLFLLAVAAIPGSLLPQRSVKIEDVNRYLAAHPKLGPILDRLWGFEVFASPWFAAIYLLLFTSLVGCVLPRMREHYQALRAAPPQAPRNLDRLPHHHTFDSHPEPRFSGWRTTRREQPDGTVEISAEKGYLKEAGNLLFHSALLVVLVGVGVGAEWGWHANRLLVAGPEQAFCNTLQQYDDYGLGPYVEPSDLPPFCLELKSFDASYLDNGQPVSFLATTADGREFSVNDPLRLDGASVYLLGHGYAPIVRYTDASGRTQQKVSPFLPKDGLLTSEGVALFPDANGGDKTRQIGFEGLYMPTAEKAPFVRSTYPGERAPALLLLAYEGDLGLDAGIPSSVYTLDKRSVKQVGQKLLRPGETWQLDDGSKIEFVGTAPWVTLSIRHDPGEPIVLVGIALLLVGLPFSLYGKRRRVWLRLRPDGTAEAGGLPRTDYPGFSDEFKKVTQWQACLTTSSSSRS